MAKNYMADIAKMLGVELEEEFKIAEDDCVYRLTEDGLIHKNEYDNWYYDNDVFLNLLDGTVEIIKLPWKPKLGEKYYIPSNYFDEARLTDWLNHPFDFAMQETGMAFKTYEECKAALPELRKKYLGGKTK